MENVEDKIIELIKNEDKKNPLTDEHIAAELHILRENVTNIRKECDIPDSRTRRRTSLIKDIKVLVDKYENISERRLTKLLNDEGYDVGKYAVGKLKNELEEQNRLFFFKNEDGDEAGIIGKQEVRGINQEEAESMNTDDDNNKGRRLRKASFKKGEDVFSNFIGYDGSLKGQISRAKAAVMYPPHGLHTLIYGPSGVGKSYLAELMHKYAVETGNFGENTPFFEFNCADYADNPQLLLSQLFGYNKGAFTGAAENKKGIVELCDGGILFLDEVHRLPAKG